MRIAPRLIWINVAAADFRHTGMTQHRQVADMSNWALTRLFNISFISIYIVGLLWEKSRRRRQATGRPPRPDGQGELKARRLPLVQWVLLTGWL
jgi:hypothetical protein